MLILYTCQLFKIRLVFHMLYPWNKVCDPQFFFISETSNSLSDRSISLKEIYQVERFHVNVLKLKINNFVEQLPATVFQTLGISFALECSFQSFTFSHFWKFWKVQNSGVELYNEASYEDALWTRHTIFHSREDCMTSPKNICVGGYCTCMQQ